jgi:serine/threonine-protein kinase
VVALGGFPTHTVDVDELARTLLVQHEQAAAARRAAAPTPVAPDLPAPYEDRGELGRGGMGAVRGAFDRDLERTVAIKALLPGLGGDDAVVATFLHEARITALIEHPNVAPVHRLERGDDGTLLLVMKLIDGQTLHEHLAELTVPPWTPEVLDSVLSVFVTVCDAVAFAHSRGVVHLDLKSANVMLGPYGQVYVLDWGSARYRPQDDGPALTAAPEMRVSAGTPSYMSPEQVLFSDADISERTDVYLLGGILYEILTGAPPHTGRTMAEVVASAIRGLVPPPSVRAPERQPPAALAEIAMRALEADPANRYPSVLELQGAVKAFRRGER